MGFRVVDQLIPFFDNLGAILADGTITCTLTGTSTAASVYTNPGLSVAAANPLGLDSAGRPDTDLWAGVPLRVVLKDSTGTVIRTLDNVQAPSSADTTLPAFEAGKFLSNDGAVASWEDIEQVPDPTGSEGRYLGVSGGVPAWLAFEEDTDAVTVEDQTDYVQIGDTMILRGSGSASTNGTANVTATVTFTPAFDSTPKVQLTVTNGPHNNSAWFASPAAINKTASGFTANFWAGAEHGSTETTITSAVTFDWVAMGTRVP